MHETWLIIIHDPGRRPGPELISGRLVDECPTTELTLLLAMWTAQNVCIVLKYILKYILKVVDTEREF